ncbi:MAG: GNAT family N-acetyltransferase [Planctomycetes bacterium]|nr:GNAT family N-acetyltransferase [Planctomycetota bacterium]
MPYGWEGEKVRLVPLEKARHFDNCVRWLNDPQVTAWTLVGDSPLTGIMEEEFFERVCRQNDSDIVFAIETLTEEDHIGISGLHQVSFRNGSAITGTLIGRPSLWRRGLGSDSIAIRSRYAFEVLGLRLLLTEVIDGNTGSLRALSNNGYREVGRIPQRYWKRGAYRDSVQMILDRATWRAANPT